MRKTQRWRVETTDEMPGDIKPTLTPLASWFSLDIAAQLDDSEDEDENESQRAHHRREWTCLHVCQRSGPYTTTCLPVCS